MMIKSKGQVLIVAILFLAVIVITSMSLFSLISFYVRNAKTGFAKEQAFQLAEAGIDKAVFSLNQGSYSGETRTAVGLGEFTVQVANVNLTTVEITSSGFVPNALNATAKRTIKVRATLGSQQIAFHYAVQIGAGGVDMENSATINGNVYSNANINGSGSSRINGDAYAVGTISSPDPTVTGTKNPNQPPSTMPTLDYQYWKDQANINNDAIDCSGTCNYTSGTTSMGPKKFIGNLTLQNTAIFTINGPIHVTGDLTLQNSARMMLNQSFGSSGTVIVVDGKVRTQNSAGLDPTSANPKGYILLATTSTANDALIVENSGVNGILYALEGRAELQNTAGLTALVAKTLLMKNSATLNYDLGLASAQFTSGPGGSWQLIKSTYRITQ